MPNTNIPLMKTLEMRSLDPRSEMDCVYRDLSGHAVNLWTSCTQLLSQFYTLHLQLAHTQMIP